MKVHGKEHFRHYLENKLFTPSQGIDKESIGIELESFAHNSKTKQPTQLFKEQGCIATSIIQASNNCTVDKLISNKGNEIINKINFKIFRVYII